ncbi:hypothetical protein [Streptomyces fulvorobeus]|uniref:Uncharacterized protein n=1 Tax=Streptomyces fulvorobeus TaxID=284028 RepID=A0A7J0CEQ0_9ACTN|nr:hypothetical protein [Streptomyces fulvorobeus]NYE44223.1 hypothetical protein [Streptomyces fulvorobeus]GFN00738.1 hypothetical protein Sfulv_55480 [Streptomyces fulvorobeus]
MTAREQIVGLIGGQNFDGGLRQIAERVADRILALHAHELAEQIRQAPFSEHLLQGHQQCAAASIIDLEATP